MIHVIYTNVLCCRGYVILYKEITTKKIKNEINKINNIKKQNTQIHKEIKTIQKQERHNMQNKQTQHKYIKKRNN